MQPDALICMPFEDYRASPAVGKSDLDLIHRSPAHYRQAKEVPEPATPAMLWGQMFHALILEPDRFATTYAVLPEGIDRRTKDGKLEWSAWQEEHSGMVAVDKPTMVELTAMRDGLMFHPLMSTIQTALCERSVFWTDDVPCKARPDMVTAAGFLADLKTCIDARPDPFARQCLTYRYYVQAAYYLDGYHAAVGEPAEGFLFVAIEKSPPYAVALYLANESMVDQGRREYGRDLETYAECLRSDRWPGYPADVMSLMLPVWAQDEEAKSGS